jgi:predicted Fe-Mo cluster-binding NifX family protein
MKIAVPVTNKNQIEEHIGNCEYYNIFTVSDNKEISGITNIKSPGGCGCNTDIASVLASDGVKLLLAAGIGGGSKKAFAGSGIDVISGCAGDSTEVVKLYLQGLIEDKGSSCSNHQHQHDHKHEHSHDHHHSHHSATSKTPEIIGIHSGGHQCGCSTGAGHGCNHN